MDILVRADAEATGLGAWMNVAIFEQHNLTLEIGANPNSLGLIKRLYHLLPNRLEYAHPLRGHRYLTRRVGGLLAAALSNATDAAMALVRWHNNRRLQPGWTLREIDHFDEGSIRTLHDRRRYADHWSLERTASRLNWRLLDNPRGRCRVLGLFRGSGLEGYMAWRIGRAGDGSRDAHVMDWLVSDAAGDHGFDALLGQLLRDCVGESVEVVRLTVLHDATGKALRRWGFRASSNPYATVGLQSRDMELKRVLTQGSSWWITPVDTDLDP